MRSKKLNYVYGYLGSTLRRKKKGIRKKARERAELVDRLHERESIRVPDQRGFFFSLARRWRPFFEPRNPIMRAAPRR